MCDLVFKCWRKAFWPAKDNNFPETVCQKREKKKPKKKKNLEICTPTDRQGEGARDIFAARDSQICLSSSGPESFLSSWLAERDFKKKQRKTTNTLLKPSYVRDIHT
jgi:hypothetical protein